MVTHWNTSVTQGALLAQYIEEYNRIQDKVHITLNSDPAASSTEKALLWAATDSMPDILPVSQVNIRTFVDSGLISPLPPDIVRRLERVYLPGALQLVSADGKIWGYPTENMPNAFTYDTVDFSNKGIGDQFPQTWPDLLAVAKRLTEYDPNGEIKRSGLGWNLDFRRNLGLLVALTWAEGREVFSKDNRTVNLLSQPVRNAVSFLIDLIHGQSIVRFGRNHSHSLQAHMSSSAIPWRVSRGVHGQSVYELLADYQSEPNGGNGYLVLLEFHPDNRLEVRSFSPYWGKYKEDVDRIGYTNHYFLDLSQ